MNIVAIIPARGGSKGIPGKNIKEFCGKPLIAYIIETALKARDETPTLPVLQHAVKHLEEKENYRPDIVVLLCPTSPLLKAERISEAIEMLKGGNFDSVLSVIEDKGHYWIEADNGYKRLYPKVLKNRQFVKPVLKENGAIYMCKRNLIMGENTIVGGRIGFLKMQKNESMDIDEPIDFKIAEFLIKQFSPGERD